MAERLQLPVLSTPEYWLALDAGYRGDHAGIGQTSLVSRLARVAQVMPDWNAEKLAAFVRAERAIVTAQIGQWRRTGNPWAAWQRLGSGEEAAYGEWLADGRFAEIEALARRLE